MDLTPTPPPGFSSPAPLATADELLAVLPWGVLVLDAQDVIRRINPQAAQWCAAPVEALVGQPLAQAPLPLALSTALRQLREPGAAPLELWLPATQLWLSLRLGPASAGQHWVFLEDTSARHQAEAAQQRSSQLLLDMEEVAHTGSYEADLGSGSFYFSDGLYRLFGEAPQSLAVTLEIINARSHPDDAATVRQVLDEAIRDKQPYTYRRRIRRPDGQWRTLEAHGEVRTDAAGQAAQLRGLVQDITERVQAEQALHAGHELLQHTIDSSLDLVQVFEAVRDEHGAVVDFTWVLNNDAAERVYGDVIGQQLCQLNPGVVEEGIFDTFRQVLETGVPDQRERYYAHEQFNGWFYQSTVKLGDGVTTTTHDISARKQAEQELRETKELLQSTLDSSHYVVQVFKAVRDGQGTIIDFTWVLTNQAWLKQYGGPMTGKSLLHENPGVVETGLFELFVQVTETGEPVDHEQYYAHEQFKAAWFHQTLVRMGDGFVMNTIDITERKRAQEEIIRLKDELAQQATDKYHALFQRMNQGFCVLEILFDEAGQQAVGFNPLEVNPRFAQESGMAARAAGDSLRELVPALDDFWLAAYGQVVRTGEPQRLERYEPKVSRWFEVHAFRIGPPAAHQVAVLFTDATARKQTEQRQQYVMQLTDALRPLADPLAIQREALAVLRAYLGSARTLYAEALDQEGTMYISTEDRDAGLVPMEGLVMRFQDYTPDGLAEAKTGRPLWRSDVLTEAHTPEQLAGYAAFGTRAWLMVPLVKNGHLVADLTVHSATARAWTAHDIALVQETTERTWAAVERARAEEALRASEAQFRAVANLGPDLLWRSSPDNATTWYNQRWHEYTGQTLEEAAGDGWKNVIHPDDQAESSRRYQAAIATVQPLRLEHRIRSAQGEYRWFQVRATPLLGEHGVVTAWYGSATDIHDRRLTEEALRASEEKYRLLFTSMSEGFALGEMQWDEAGNPVDWRYLEVNQAWEQTGVPVGQTVGRTAREVNPAIEPGWIATYGRVVQTGEPASYEAYAAGFGKWFDTFAFKHSDNRFGLLFRDITTRKQAEEALRQSEEKYRTLFNTIDEGFAMVEVLPDEYGRVTDMVWREANAGVERHAGLGSWVGKRASELVPLLEQSWLDALTGVYQTGEPVRMEAYNADLGRWIDTYYARLGSAGSPLIAVVFNDITERKHREQRQEFLLKLSDALRAELTADAVANRALGLLCEQLQLDRCYMAKYQLEADHADITHQFGNDRVPPLPAGGIRLSDFPEAFRVVFDQTLVIDDVAETAGLSATDRRNIGAMGLRALVAATLRQGPHRPHWVLVAVSASPRHWTPGEIALLEDVAERTWAAMQRAKIEEELRASEATLAAVFDALPVGIGLTDAHGRLNLANHQMRRYLPTGIMPSRDETQPLRWHAERPDGSPLPPTEFPGTRAQRGEKVVPGIEMLHTPAGGPPVWTQVFAVPLPPRPGQVAGHVTAILDIDARKRAAAALRVVAEAQTLRLRLADALGPLTDAVAIQETVTRLARQHFGANRCYYCEIEHGQAIIRHDAATEGLPSVAGTYPLADFALLQAVIEAGQPFIVRDVRADESVDDNLRHLCVQLHVISCLDVPVIKNGQPVGVLCLVQSTPRDWTAAETALAAEVAERTWTAVERTRAEEALAASEVKYRTLFETIDEGFCVIELVFEAPGQVADLIYREANAAFAQHAGIGNVVGKRATELFPRIEQHWLASLARVQHTGVPERVEGYNADTQHWFTLQYSRVGGAGSPLVAAVFNDITERKRREANLAFLVEVSEDLVRLGHIDETLNALGEKLAAYFELSACVFAELVDDAQVGIIRNGWHRADMPSLLGTYRMADFVAPEVLRRCRAGEVVVIRNVFTDPLTDGPQYAALNVHSFVSLPLVRQGKWHFLLVVYRSEPHDWREDKIELLQELTARIWTRLERARAEEALAASEARLRALIGNLPGAAAFVVGPDLRYQLAGGEALAAAGLVPADLLGRTVAEAMPPELVVQYKAHYRQALAGQDLSLEHTAHGRTFISRGVPLLDAAGQPEAVLVVSYDITERKQVEEALRASEAQLAEFNTQLEQRVARRTQQLQASRDLLQSVLDTSLISMSVLDAVRDEAGQVQDFRLTLVNKELERETGRSDLVGKLYAQEYPGIRQVGIFDLMLRALATDEPQGMEYFYEYEGFNRWYSCQFVRLGDGLVATNLDITERKTAEQERLKNLRLLEQAEAVAGLGSWDYDLATGHMRWSDGMYHLVNLPLGQPVSPDVYLQLVVDEDRPRAERLVRQLTTGQSAEETLRLRVGEQVKTVRLKAVVLRDEAGHPARVLGVDVDISELQRLEADNLHLRLTQQQALFEAVQEAQETERKRMAESLHNGIGQILYATKLRLDLLRPPVLADAPAQEAARQEADHLLGEAIRQTRALSHELVPMILEEFGLAAALQDIGQKMSTTQLQLHTHAVLDKEAAPLTPMLQMALYRMAQELAQNIAKHAHGATEASLELETTPGWVLLRAEDNGPGFASASAHGLGLRSIRDRVALLGGKVESGSAPAGGAYVRIRIPLPMPD